MLAFNSAPANTCAFNADDECPFLPAPDFWRLFLDPNDDNVFIASGAGVEIPPNLMFPGQDYLIDRRIFVVRPINTQEEIQCLNQFRTPPAITFDELGG